MKALLALVGLILVRGLGGFLYRSGSFALLVCVCVLRRCLRRWSLLYRFMSQLLGIGRLLALLVRCPWHHNGSEAEFIVCEHGAYICVVCLCHAFGGKQYETGPTV